MDKITSELNKSLIIDTSEIIGDYVELGIDSVLDYELVKELPIFRSIIGIGKTIINVRERNLFKNLVVFINELNNGVIDKDKLRYHIDELNDNPKQLEKELDRILVILEQTIDNLKIVYLAKVYKAYINQQIKWDIFIELSEIINRFHVNDFPVLSMIYKGLFSDTTNRSDLFRIERLNALGVIGLTPKAIYIGMSSGRQDTYIVLNGIGKVLGDILFK